MDKEKMNGFEGLYKITKSGRIFICGKTWTSGRWVTRTTKEREITYGYDRRGYQIVSLRKNGNTKQYKVHRLIALHYLQNPENKPEVNHKNGVKWDNRLKNLEWCTRLENFKHAKENGLMKPVRGENNGRSKLTISQVLQIRKEKLSTYKLAKIYNVVPTTILAIRNRKLWKHVP